MKGIVRRFFWTWLLALVLGAQAAAAIDVFVRNPRDGDVVFGIAEVEIEVLSAEPVKDVRLKLDGELVAVLERSPYKVAIDFGDDNVSRLLEVTARDILDQTAVRTIKTGVIALNMELDVALQQLYITATRDGSRVLDLEREDFEILDDGDQQEIVTFERGDVPFTAVLLLDSSLSMAGERLRSVLRGASTFVGDMRELDEAQVLVFSDRTLAATPLTSDPAEVRAVFNRVDASGGTAIYDHLYLALKELDKRQGRRVVILLSDGIDVESVLRLEDVAWKAGRTQALIYWIRPMSRGGHDPSTMRYHSAWRGPEKHREEIAALERAVRESGGRVRTIQKIEEASEAFQEILAELRDQYVVGYYPTVNLDNSRWHRVRVRLNVNGVRVRTRDGYFDDD